MSTKISFLPLFCFFGYDPDKPLKFVIGLITAFDGAVALVNIFHLDFTLSLPVDESFV